MAKYKNKRSKIKEVKKPKSTKNSLRGRSISDNASFGFWKKSFKIIITIATLLAIPGTYITIRNYLLERETYIESLPARIATVSEAEVTYGYLLAATKNTIKPIRPNLSQLGRFRDAMVYINGFEYQLNKLDYLIIKNNGTLGSNLISQLSVFTTDAHFVLKKLKFFVDLQNPDMNNCDFVSTGPFVKVREIQKITQNIDRNYPGIFPQKGDKGYQSVGRIEDIWIEVDAAQKRLCLNPSRYRFNSVRNPYVFDIKNLQKLPVPPTGFSPRIKVKWDNP